MLRCLLLLTLAVLLPAQTQPDEALKMIAEGRYEEARHLVARLVREGEERGAGPAYRAGLRQLAAMIANSLSRYDEARQEAEHGLALLEAGGGSAQVAASLLVTAAEAFTALGRFDKAEAALQRARKTLPDGDPRHAAIEDGFGALWLSRRQLDKAEQAYRAAFELLESRLGPHHPDITPPALMLASLLETRGKTTEAANLLTRSIAILEKARGPSHPGTLAARVRLGFSQLESDPRQSEQTLRTALDAWLATQPQRQLTVAAILTGLAAARMRQSDPAGAAEFGARSLALLRECVGAEHPQVVAAMFKQSRLLRAAKRKKEAGTLEAAAERIRKDRGYVDLDRHTVDIRALIPR